MKDLFFVLVLFPVLVFAQNASVKVNDIPAEGEGNTTIEIRKGDKSNLERKYDITEGTAEVSGDSSALIQDARKNWKKACAEWKTEIKDQNKENQVLLADCGSMKCSTVTMESTCVSQAKYKLKIQVR